MDAGSDVRGRQVRARVLTRSCPVRAATAAAAGLTLLLPAAPAPAAAPSTTGRLLVTLQPAAPDGAPRTARAAAATGAALARAAGARRAGFSVPQIGLVTLRPLGGRSPRAVARRLRADPRVASVEPETRALPRYVPNDPALTIPETAKGTEPGTPVEWWVARTGLPAAWDITRGDGALVGVIDTGVEASHPELADRVADAASFDFAASPATVDTVGHGTHVASLACALGDNGLGLTGAGLGCKLLAVKSDFSDSSVAASLVWAADHGAHAVNMSFGTAAGARPTQAVRNAVDYAYARDVVLVGAAADEPIEDQGHPANLLQPSGTGPDIAQGRGLSVTAAIAADRRASFAGLGTQISLAAYGAYDDKRGPNGLFGAFTAAPNELEAGGPIGPTRPPCRCRTDFGEDNRYAYLQGTSMAAPIVAATAALVRDLNPDLGAADVIRLLKETARRPGGGGWTRELGWGLLDAGAALREAQALDRRPPVSAVRRTVRRTRRTRLTVRWTGADAAPAGVRASGVARYELWRSANGRPAQRIASTTATTSRVRLRRGSRYAFYTVAVDRAGNREPAPRRPDATVRVRRG